MPKHVNMSDIEFEVVSFNVHGKGDDLKRRKIFNYMKKQIWKSYNLSARNPLD